MEVTVHRDKRIVEVWLTNQEQADNALREKLQDSEKYGWCIRTVWGVGYKFEMK